MYLVYIYVRYIYICMSYGFFFLNLEVFSSFLNCSLVTKTYKTTYLSKALKILDVLKYLGLWLENE